MGHYILDHCGVTDLLTVHHLNNSRSQRILWLLEELGIEYDLKRYRRDPQTLLAPRSLRDVHPLGKSPVVTDGERVLAESGAIIEYLVDEYGGGRLRPEAGSDEFLRYRYWMHYAEGSAMPPLLMKLVFMELPGASPFLVRPLVAAISSTVQKTYVDRQIELHARYWEEELARATWFVGEQFTAADIQMSFPLEAALSRTDMDAKPRVREFVQQIQSRAAYRRALERGGPYTLADG